MQHLTLPVTAAEDETVINKLAKELFWAPFQSDWIAAYRAYQAAGGNPFSVKPLVFQARVSEEQYALYDSRKNSGELKRMRDKKGLKSCPICGSPGTGSLDHYLPRKIYPEFAIMRANLVPACVYCNTHSKGEKVHGDEPRCFIHPYYNSWAAGDLWFVEVIPPYKAATFKPSPGLELPSPKAEIVAFHLENVLGEQFQRATENYWSSFPGALKIRDRQLTTASVTELLKAELHIACHAEGNNSWRAALLRGINTNPTAIEYLREKAIADPLPPFPSKTP